MAGEPLYWQPWHMNRLKPEEYEAGRAYLEAWQTAQKE